MFADILSALPQVASAAGDIVNTITNITVEC
ncbi:hypothetical protein SAMN05445756_0534 [Kytococcus aerolatus]|uniref:Uncharacterized protein n=1 Tax=Kytococcus aerolatus TaxID=592308 RepID=A0A212T6L4_9MICO|nr:hypothetical protein SAMN05445756_0534 [Kytococcus aerolatus]